MLEPELARGRVLRLHRKPLTPGPRGPPKHAVREVRITRAGVVGDHNAYRYEVAGDDPAMAVRIMPEEMLADLHAKGWPIRPGDSGEHLTSVGLRYDEFAPGRRYRAAETRLEISKPCTPCDNLSLLPYVGAARGPKFLKVMLDRRGWNARVIEEGRVKVGGPIVRMERSDAGGPRPPVGAPVR